MAQGTPAAKPAAAPAAKAPAAAPAAAAKKPLTDAEKKDAAKAAYKEAEAKFEKGDYAGALVLYQQADELVPGSAPKYRAAVALDKMSKLKEAIDAYKKFLDSSPDPEKYAEKINDAKARIDAIAKTPAKVKVAIAPAAPADLKLAVDGTPQTGTELSVAPGKHTITASAAGFDMATLDIDVTFGEARDVSMTLNPSAAPIAAVPPPSTTPPPVAATEPRSNIPAYVTLGLAGAGAIVGTIFGIQALGSKSDYEANPSQDLFDDTERNALLADMSFGVAITFGVTGAVLLLSGDSPEAKTTGATTAPKATTISKPLVLPYVGPNGGGASATVRF